MAVRKGTLTIKVGGKTFRMAEARTSKEQRRTNLPWWSTPAKRAVAQPARWVRLKG